MRNRKCPSDSAQSETPSTHRNSTRENRETPSTPAGDDATGRLEKGLRPKSNMHVGMAFPAGGITVWRVNASNSFAVPAAIASGTGKTAVAPAVTPVSANTRLFSVFGAGNRNSKVFQQLGGGPGIGADETIALKVIGGPSIETYYAHEVGDRIQMTEPGKSTIPQSVDISEAGNPSGNSATWEAITLALREGGDTVPGVSAQEGS